MILAIGEILFDVFPDYRRLGGAPFNFACHLKQLGFAVRFVSRIGDDPGGKDIQSIVKDRGFDPADLQIDACHATGEVDIRLDPRGVPTFDILPNVAYDHIDFTPALGALLEDCTLIYFGTLAQRTDQGYRNLQRILDARKPQTKCLYDINFRPGSFRRQAVGDSLRHADLLKLNEEELEGLKEMHAAPRSDDDFVAFLREGYAIEEVALTRGHKGSTLFTTAGRFDAATPPLETIADTVGAGDAFASVLAAGYLRGLPPAQTLEAASFLASRLCTVAGAIPEDNRFYDDVIQMLER
ncbi:MAG: PfkB family carbohydrate kinase [Desulfobacterales bacterium]